ncbi:MAG: hypothetical protein GYA51_07145 [Candidatus Methanofastidiosa archaeon]|nr:hypothetical protein [Candidatus Methanofastidiosa archaeon]
MLETPHVAVGAAIASKIPNPFIAIPLAFTSHFVMEMVPHWNPHIVHETKTFGHITKKSLEVIILDSTLALGLGTFVAYQALPDVGHALTIFFACFASVLPDLVESPYFFFNSRAKILKAWIKFQKTLQVDTTPFWGLATQVVTVIAAWLWLKS